MAQVTSLLGYAGEEDEQCMLLGYALGATAVKLIVTDDSGDADTCDATITVEEGSVRAQAEFFIKRNDFGIIYPGKPDDLIRDEVVIRFDLIAVPAAG